MSSDYQIGSLCDDCMQYGLENYLKPFYINLDEQIVKCESSSCMFPYLRKPVLSDLSNCKPLENTLFLDEFIEQSLKKIDESPPKQDIKKCTTKLELNTSDMYDFSAIFMDNPIKSEEKPLVFEIFKQEQERNVQPIVLESKVITNSWKIQDLKPNVTTNLKKHMQPHKKMRISKCLSNVKSTSKSSNLKKPKALSEKIEPVLVIEPNSGKSMRPLDLIKRYLH